MAPGPGARLAAQFAAVGPPPTLDSSWCHSYAVSHANRHPLPLPGPPTAALSPGARVRKLYYRTYGRCRLYGGRGMLPQRGR